MPRRVTLVVLWAVFAVASVSVGFAAAGLVSDPFTDVGTTADVADLAGPGDDPAPEPDGAPTDRATGTPAPSTKTPRVATTTHPPSGSGATRSRAPTKHTSTASSAPSTIRGGISTRGGYVSGTCSDGLVSVGAAPAVWWQVASITSGRVRTARVRLEPSKDANGERVDVTAICDAGIPVFHPDYKGGGGGGDSGDSGDSGRGGGGSGGGDSGDSGGSGDDGSDSSGSGSG